MPETLQSAQPELTPLEIRLALLENGYHPVLARGKVADVTGWRIPVASFEKIIELTQANRGHLNTGLLCGSLVALDIDALDPETSAALLDMALALPGADKALRRVGKAPKVTLLFRATVASKKMTTKPYRLNGWKCQVEIMGDGQQVIGFGTHPDTQEPYRWIGPSPLDVAFAGLPEIAPETIVAFVADAEAYLAQRGELITATRPSKPQHEYKPTEQRAPAGDGIWAELKSRAMANLGAWVRDLGLSGTKTYADGFLARADFRPSTSSTGKAGNQRGLSVCFSPDGIVDYADGNQGYNPIDITSVALGISPSEAADWLRARVGDERPASPGFADALITKAKAPAAAKYEAANDNHRRLPSPPAMHPDPYSPSAAGGLIEDIAKWISSTAIIKVPELSLAASLALLAGAFGSIALTPTLCGVGLYLTTIVKTAGGKGRPPSAIRALADKALCPGSVSNSDPTSFAAFERILRKNSSPVAVLDEFGLMLQGVNSKRPDPAASSIRKFLLIVYDRSNDAFDGKAYASSETKKDDSPIDGPSLTVLSMTTGETLYKGLSQDSVSDGFLNRFVFVEAADNPNGIQPPDLTADNRPPVHLVEALQKAVLAFPVKASIPGKSATQKFRVPFFDGLGSDAHKAWNEIFMWQNDPAWEEVQSKLRGRAAENTIRLATLRAISRNPYKPMVTVDDVQWGWAIVYRSIANMDSGVEKMASSIQEQMRNAIVKALRDEGGVIYRSRLMRLSAIKSAGTVQDYTSALSWLFMSGEVEDISEKGDGSKLFLSSDDREP